MNTISQRGGYRVNGKQRRIWREIERERESERKQSNEKCAKVAFRVWQFSSDKDNKCKQNAKRSHVNPVGRPTCVRALDQHLLVSFTLSRSISLSPSNAQID